MLIPSGPKEPELVAADPDNEFLSDPRGGMPGTMGEILDEPETV